jgi:hypothetical protein
MRDVVNPLIYYHNQWATTENLREINAAADRSGDVLG